MQTLVSNVETDVRVNLLTQRPPSSRLVLALRSPQTQTSWANWTALTTNYDIAIRAKAHDAMSNKGRPHALYRLHGG